ncbi:MAG: hypothetical protein JRD84_11470 [Deltaproteobacteria bacterium]|nr:hypothetical protein [Deltaproteobacteria bacterium]
MRIEVVVSEQGTISVFQDEKLVLQAVKDSSCFSDETVGENRSRGQ